MQLQTIDFNNVVKDIETYKIVLPDFQREFVWRKYAKTDCCISIC